MPALYYPNMTFEEEIAGADHRVPLRAQRVVAELAPLMGLLSEFRGESELPPGDRDVVLVEPDSIPLGIPAALQHVRFETRSTLQGACGKPRMFQPWGWSSGAIAEGQRLNPGFTSPDPMVVRRVNSRQFLSQFDRYFPLHTECATPGDASCPEESGGMLCSTIDDIQAALREFSRYGVGGWVIKSNFSQAARNRLLGTGLNPDTTQLNWLRKRFDRSEPVYAEPWYERIAECGLQFEVPPSSWGPAEFRGGCEMITDAVGRYRGSIISYDDTPAWWDPAKSHCQIIADHMGSLGFFGAVGIDCMLFRHPVTGRPCYRVCHDLNGRLTMGRIALSLKAWLRPGETGFWCHTSAGLHSGGPNVFDALNVKNFRIVPTSPSRIGTQPADSQTVLLISDDCEILTQVARKILSQDIRGPFPDAPFPARLSVGSA